MARKRVQAALLSLLLICSAAAMPVAGAIAGGQAATGTTTLLSPTTYSATEHVEVWERAALPLRTDTTNAETTVTNPGLFVEYQPDSSGPLSVHKSETAVYGTDSTISLSFESRGGAGTSQFEGKTTELVVARIEPDASTSLTDISMPTDLDEARELLSPSSANSNASFTVQDTGSVSGGSVSAEFSPDQSGVYVFFLATNESGSFSTSGGDLSVTGDVTIVGLDTAVVQQSSASISPSASTVTRGSDVSFQVNSPSGSPANHTVVLYREQTWTNAEFQLVVQNPVSANMDESDFRLEHSIDNVTGTADFDGPVTVMGATFGDQRYSGTTSTPSLLDFVVERANDETSGSPLSAIATSDRDPGTDTTLFASAAGVANADSPALTVETGSTWAPGTYRWVYLGGGTDNADIHTQTGTISVQASTGGGGTPGGGGGPVGTPGDGPPDDTPGQGPPTDAPPVSTPRGTVSGGSGSVTVTPQGAVTRIQVSQASQGAQVTLELPTNSRSQQLSETGASLNAMRMDFGGSGSFQADVSFSATNPQPDIPEINPGQADQAFGYIQVQHDASDDVLSDVTFEFSVSKDRLADRGISAGDVMLYRFNNGAWTGYSATVVSEDDGTYTLETTVPGLSVFAIGTRQQAQTGFTVTDASVSDSTVNIAEDFEVTATVENTGNVESTYTINLTENGAVVEQQSVTIPAHESQEVTFTWEIVEAGDYTMGVSGTEAGVVTVESGQTTTTQPPTTSPPTTGTQQPPTPGPVTTPAIAFIALLIAVVGAGVFFLYRQGYFE